MNFELPEDIEEEAMMMRVTCYRKSLLKDLLYLLLCVCSAGFVYLLCRWYLNLKIKIRLILTTIKSADFYKIEGIGINFFFSIFSEFIKKILKINKENVFELVEN